MPLLRRFVYRLPHTSGVGAGALGLGAGNHTGDGVPGPGVLADTGFDAVALLLAALALLVLGSGAQFVARRSADRPD